MKAFIVASILAVIASTATAQSAGDSSTVTINAAGPVITLPAVARPMTSSEFGKFTGSYTLSNGKSLTLFVRGSAKYAAIEGEGSHILVAKSGNSFVAKDKQLAMTIELHDHAEPSGEVLIAVPGERLANGEMSQKVVKLSMQ